MPRRRWVGCAAIFGGAYAMAEAQRTDAGGVATSQAFRRAAERALSLAPYQPQLWLRLAKLDESDPLRATQFNAVAKMVYYTAPADGRRHGGSPANGAFCGRVGRRGARRTRAQRRRAMIAHNRVTELSVIYRSLGVGARALIENAVKSIRPDLVPRLAAPG